MFVSTIHQLSPEVKRNDAWAKTTWHNVLEKNGGIHYRELASLLRYIHSGQRLEYTQLKSGIIGPRSLLGARDNHSGNDLHQQVSWYGEVDTAAASSA